MSIILAHDFIPHHHHYGFIEVEKKCDCCDTCHHSDNDNTVDFNNTQISIKNMEVCHACHFSVDKFTELTKKSIFIAITPTIYKYLDLQYIEYRPLDIIKDNKQSFYSSTRLRDPPIIV